MPGFGSDPDDTTTVGPDVKSEATSMFSGLPAGPREERENRLLPDEQKQRQNDFVVERRYTPSETRGTQGTAYGETQRSVAEALSSEPSASDATRIFGEPAYPPEPSAMSWRPKSAAELPVAREVRSSSTNPGSARENEHSAFADSSFQQASDQEFRRWQPRDADQRDAERARLRTSAVAKTSPGDLAQPSVQPVPITLLDKLQGYLPILLILNALLLLTLIGMLALTSLRG